MWRLGRAEGTDFMKSLRQRASVRRVSVAMLVAAATACTRSADPSAAEPPSATSAPPVTATPEQPIPNTASPPTLPKSGDCSCARQKSAGSIRISGLATSSVSRRNASAGKRSLT